MSESIRQFEECLLRAWPALETTRVGGWVVRFAAGYTGRANSVTPFAPAPGAVREAIGTCERLFRERNLRSVFRLSPAAQPLELDALLEAEGYALSSPAQVRTLPIEAAAPRVAETGVELLDCSPSVWLEPVSRWAGIPPKWAKVHRAILERIRLPRLLALLRAREGAVAAGFAVADGSLLGLYDLVTAPEARGRGYGSRVLEGLLEWGRRRRARLAYLQVAERNEGAVRLLERAGFRRSYRYWYRVSTREDAYPVPVAFFPGGPAEDSG